MYFDSPFADTLSDVGMAAFRARCVAIIQSPLEVSTLNVNTARYDDAATRPIRMVQLSCVPRGHLSTDLLSLAGMFTVLLNTFQRVNIH
jgi:hypothetical protein